MTIRTFHPVTGVASAQGLDVSNWQGRFNWAATSGLSFGINRVTQGLGAPGTNSPDPEAGWNHAAIRDAGLHRGAYHFLDPGLNGATQARYFVDVLGQHGLVKDDMLFLDNETPGTSPAATAACANAFMNELHTLRPENPIGVYSNLSFDQDGYDAGLGKWAAWLAWPESSVPVAPPVWSTWKFWQWGLRNGIDADAFNGTTTDLDAWIAAFQPPVGPVWQAWHSDGKTSLAQLANTCGLWVSHILAATATEYQRFDAVSATYISAGDWTRAIPTGATLWVRK